MAETFFDKNSTATIRDLPLYEEPEPMTGGFSRRVRSATAFAKGEPFGRPLRRGISPRVRSATAFAKGEPFGDPPGDFHLAFAPRPRSPKANPLATLRGIFTSRSLRDRVRQRRTGENGDNRIRTGDPLLAKQVLYQLSYVP